MYSEYGAERRKTTDEVLVVDGTDSRRKRGGEGEEGRREISTSKGERPCVSIMHRRGESGEEKRTGKRHGE